MNLAPSSSLLVEKSDKFSLPLMQCMTILFSSPVSFTPHCMCSDRVGDIWSWDHTSGEHMILGPSVLGDIWSSYIGRVNQASHAQFVFYMI